MSDLTTKLEEAITKVVVELIQINAVLEELERSFPYTAGSYYWERKRKLEERKAEIENILLMSKVGYVKDAPVEQYLVTRNVG